jgi:hypothetical protein
MSLIAIVSHPAFFDEIQQRFTLCDRPATASLRMFTRILVRCCSSVIASVRRDSCQISCQVRL